MLRKLLKYEFLATSRTCGLLYVTMPIVALLLGLMLRFQMDDTFLFGIVSFAFVCLCICSICFSVYVIVNRFKNNLLGDEGYLMFTLPAETWKHIVCKVINAMIWMVILSLVFVVSFLLMAVASTTLESFKQFFEVIQYVLINFEFSSIDYVMVLQFVVLLTLVVVTIITHVYASIAVGHLWRNHNGIGSAITFIALMIFFFSSINFVDPDTFGLTTLFFVIIIALYSTITWFILDRHLNLA